MDEDCCVPLLKVSVSSGKAPEMAQQHDSPAWRCPAHVHMPLEEKQHSWRFRDALASTQQTQAKLFPGKPALPSLACNFASFFLTPIQSLFLF